MAEWLFNFELPSLKDSEVSKDIYAYGGKTP